MDQRFVNEYLPALREHHKMQGTVQNKIQRGDVVLVYNENKPRLQWKLAQVEQLLPGKDGLVRSMKIKTENGITSRPITKHPLEITAMCDSPTPKGGMDTMDTDLPQRPSHDAALAAKFRIEDYYHDE